jgi:hypothetical protein
MTKGVKGAKSRFTAKEDRQVQHIVDSEVERGMGEEEARRVAFAHVSAQLKAHGGKHLRD